MKKFLTKQIITAVLAFLFGVASVFGFQTTVEQQDKISTVIIEKIVPVQ